MLHSISIQNYALINKLDIEFSNGFSVITGETGSGKSILLGALSLVLGQRAEGGVLKDDSKKCIIECAFVISKYKLQDFFSENGLDYEEETLLRREVLPSGKSRAFVNDSPVSLKILKELGLRLVDIHSQNQNMVLGSFEYQLGIVDTYAGSEELLRNYQEKYKAFKEITRRIAETEELAKKEKADLDYYQFQLKQLAEVDLVAGEQEQMESELETLNHSEEIKSQLFKAFGCLSEGEFAVINNLKEVRSALAHIKEVYPEAENLYKRIESSYIEVQDLSHEIDRCNDSVELDPARIDYLNQHLDAIYSLQQKHRVDSVEELIRIREELKDRVDSIQTSDDIIQELRNEMEVQQKELQISSDKLSLTRKKEIPTIEKTIINQLVLLGIPNANFKVQIEPTDSFQHLGKDNICFLFSANKNARLEEIQRVASGGEISRLMLSIKYLVSSSTALPSIVFDEIDTGVSGEIADKMGAMMNQMAENIQVISITHLPQIAGRGKYHYKVYKIDDENETYSNIVLLNKQKRLEELAKMLSGSDLTTAALENAKVLLNS